MRTKTVIAALALLAGCDSCLPTSCQVPEKRKMEVYITTMHQSCICAIQVCTPSAVRRCHDQSETDCLDAGLPKHCGNEEREGSCGECAGGR